MRPAVDEIVIKANHMAFYQKMDAKGKVEMVITDKQGRTRNRVFNMLRKDDGKDDCDQKFFSFFQAPADVRKMVFMVHKHAVQKTDSNYMIKNTPKKPDNVEFAYYITYIDKSHLFP